MMNPEVDIQKFADMLVKAGREGVAWEQKKLEWILEQRKQASEKQKAA